VETVDPETAFHQINRFNPGGRVAADSRKAAADGEAFHEMSVCAFCSSNFPVSSPGGRSPPPARERGVQGTMLSAEQWAGELSDLSQRRKREMSLFSIFEIVTSTADQPTTRNLGRCVWRPP
jgi:hypothetical protein